MKVTFDDATTWTDCAIFGWMPPEGGALWSSGRTSIIRVPVDDIQNGKQILCRLHVIPVLCAGVPFQRLGITLNGEFKASIVLRKMEIVEFHAQFSATGGQRYIFFELSHPDFFRQSDFGINEDGREFSIALKQIDVEVASEDLFVRNDGNIGTFTGMHEDERSAIKVYFKERLRKIEDLLFRNADASDGVFLAALIDGVCAESQGHGQMLQRRIINIIRDYERNSHHQCNIFEFHSLVRADKRLREHFFEPVDNRELSTLPITSAIENRLYNKFFEQRNRGSVVYQNVDVNLYSVKGGDVVVDPYFYQVIERGGRRAFVSAAPKVLSKKFVNGLPRRRVVGDIVIIQDVFYGENFCHFAFDYLTRILHFLRQGMCSERTLFVLGGIPYQFHEILLGAIAKTSSLSPNQFMFPISSAVLEVDGAVHWFSDQIEAIAHPAQCANPKSVALLRDVAQAVASEGAKFEMVYISRLDAWQRRPANERELADVLQSMGFHTVIMTNHSIEEQISIFRHARVIIAPHGMALTFLMFATRCERFIELNNKTMGTAAYGAIATALGIEYVGLYFEDLGNHHDYFVDISAVRAALS